MKKYLLTIVWFFVACMFAVNPVAVQAAGEFKTGWWLRVNRSDLLAQFAAEGNTLVLADQAIWYTNSGDNTIKTFLDTAQANGIKVIMGISGPWQVPTENFINCINTYKSHPALYAWYIGDEPELYGWYIHDYLDVNPGFYHLAKQNDPNHPVLISFNQTYSGNQWDSGWDWLRSWYDVTDLIGIHAYSSYAGAPEFGTGEATYFYDEWRQLVEDTETYNKPGCIATCQGFGDNWGSSFKTPTLNELHYAVFSAVVNGVDKVLFWLYDGIGELDSVNVANVNRMIAEMQSIGAEMNAGETSSPEIRVSESAERLTYRYGASGESHVLLAVNIADRQAGGSPITAQFTLPTGVSVDRVEVLHENRTISVTNGAFTDDFEPFEVHIYRFTADSETSPAPEPAPTEPAPAPEEPAPAPAPAPTDLAPAPEEPAPALSPVSSSPLSRLLNLIGRKANTSGTTGTATQETSAPAPKPKVKREPSILFRLSQLLKLS